MITCKKGSNTTPSSTAKGSLSLASGNSQNGVYGQDLTNAIALNVTPLAGKSYTLRFNMIQGNGLIGNVSPDYPLIALTNLNLKNGSISVQWRLGCNTPNQKLTISLYSNDQINATNGQPVGMADDSVTVNATGTKPSGWGRACGCGTPAIGTKIATFDNQTLYMASYGLYSSTDGGTNWIEVTGAPNWATISDVQFNSKGWMYILTGSGVYYTQDKKNWTSINNGISQPISPTMLFVNDSILMVSYYYDGPYISINNGASWQKLTVGYNSQRYYLAKQHPSGAIYMFNDWGDFLTSNDLGKTWQLIPTTSQTVAITASDLGIAQDGTIYVSSDYGTFSSFSPQTNTWLYKSYGFSTAVVNHIQFYNNNVYFLVNNTTNPGIYSGTANNYTIVNTGFGGTPVNYFIKSDGTFLLGTDDGSFYYHN